MSYSREEKMVGGSMCFICLLFTVFALVIGSWVLTVVTLFSALFSLAGGWILERLFGSPMPVSRDVVERERVP